MAARWEKRHFGTKNPTNQETTKPRNQQSRNPNPRNQENQHTSQVRETPAPLNIPAPTPAPDQGGPVACLGGPIAGTTQAESRTDFIN